MSERALPSGRGRLLAAAAVLVALAVGLAAALRKPAADDPAAGKAAAPASRPALTVTAVTPHRSDWPYVLSAAGNIAAWQEAVIGAEIAGLRLTEVLVNVGDTVRRGQPLARIAADAVAADLAQAEAAVAEAQAALAEAEANVRRTRDLTAKGFVSAQATLQVQTVEQTAQARLAAARARVQAENVRIAQTRIVAPDDGVISSRTAVVGSLAQPGQELFRLIRGGRLEWRAEVTAAELARIRPGLRATLTTPMGERVEGRVRTVAPTIDSQTRNAIVYVDLPPGGPARAGMFARGEFELGRSEALTLPQSAVLVRDGFAYAFRIGGDGKVEQIKIDVGRRVGERIEIVGGLGPDTRVVETGAGFLSDGDLVRVVDAPARSAAR